MNTFVESDGQKCFQSALDLISKADHGKAFAYFLLGMNIQPSLKENEEFETEFVSCLDTWTEKLVELNRIKDAVWCYEQACEVWQDNPYIVHATGLFLFRFGHRIQGVTLLHKASMLAPWKPDWNWDLQNASSSLVERWHFRMLNDSQRNAAYYRAIKNAVQRGHQMVLDIGSGTGLLSIMAAKAGAKSVAACEMSKVMCDMSAEIIKENDVSKSITVINKKSTELTIPEDLSKRVSLIVTETADAGLLGEHMVESLEHAWQNLLDAQGNKMGCQVIPAGASVFIQIIECDYIHRQHRYLGPYFNNVEVVSDVTRVSSKSMNIHEQDEPYTSENLSHMQGGWKPLTAPIKLASFDFCKPKILTNKHKELKTRDITVTTTGRLDAIILWFELVLDEENILSSSPDSGSCWEQAVYPCHPSQWDGNHNAVTTDDIITLSYTCTTSWINVCLSNIKRLPSSNKAPSKTDTNCNNQQNFVQLSSRDIECMNDIQYQKYLEEAVRIACKRSGVYVRNGANEQDCTNKDKIEVEESDTLISKNVTNGNADISSHILEAYCRHKSGGASDLVHGCDEVDHHMSLSTEEHHRELKSCHRSKTANDFDDYRKDENLTNSSKIINRSTVPADPSQSKQFRSNNVSENDLVMQSVSHCRPIDQDEFESNTVAENNLSIQNPGSSRNIGSVNHVTTQDGPVHSSYLDLDHKCVKSKPKTDYQIIDLSGTFPLYLTKLDLEYTVGFIGSDEVRSAMQRLDGALRCDTEFVTSLEDVTCRDNRVKIIIHDPIESSGVMKRSALEDVYFTMLQSAVVCQVLPCSFTTMGVCIDSLEMVRNTRVMGSEPTLGIKVDNIINRYKTSTQLDVALDSLQHKPITEPFTIHEVNFNAISHQDPEKTFSHRKDTKTTALSDGEIVGVAFWFDIMMSLGQQGQNISTRDKKTHWLQAVYMLESPVRVNKGDRLLINASFNQSCYCFGVTVIK